MTEIEKGKLNWHKSINENFDELDEIFQEQQKEIDSLKKSIPNICEGYSGGIASFSLQIPNRTLSLQENDIIEITLLEVE